MEKYTKPQFEVIKFEVENVITASSTEIPNVPSVGGGGLPIIPSPTSGDITD